MQTLPICPHCRPFYNGRNARGWSHQRGCKAARRRGAAGAGLQDAILAALPPYPAGWTENPNWTSGATAAELAAKLNTTAQGVSNALARLTRP